MPKTMLAKTGMTDRIEIEAQGNGVILSPDGQIMLDRIRTLDKSWLMDCIAEIDVGDALTTLRIMFSP